MVEQSDIIELQLIASAYMLELGEEVTDSQSIGCIGQSDLNIIAQLMMLKKQLTYKIEAEDFGEETDKLYQCLSDLVGSYSGSSITVDPNAGVDGITIIVEGGGGDNRPYPLIVNWSDFEPSDEPNGGRNIFYNAEWKGWTPLPLNWQNIELLPNIDYISLEDGGIELLANGKLPYLYEGDHITAEVYTPYISPTPPVGKSVTVFNKSNLKSDDTPNGYEGGIASVFYEGGGADLSVGSSGVIPQSPDIDIRVDVPSQLVLKSGATLIPMDGFGNPNVFATGELEDSVTIYNNNEAPNIPDNQEFIIWNDSGFDADYEIASEGNQPVVSGDIVSEPVDDLKSLTIAFDTATTYLRVQLFNNKVPLPVTDVYISPYVVNVGEWNPFRGYRFKLENLP